MNQYDSDYWHGETYRCIMRVFLSGLIVSFHRSTVVRSFWGVLLAYVFVEITRAYQPYLHATNNAIASAAQYQVFFTYFIAFIIVAEPFNSDNSALSVVLLFANLAVFYVAFKRARSELDSRRNLSKLQEQTKALASQLEQFEGAMLAVVAVDRAIGGSDRQKFLPGGDWCALASKEGALGKGRPHSVYSSLHPCFFTLFITLARTAGSSEGHRTRCCGHRQG